jgi:hypothetical protein
VCFGGTAAAQDEFPGGSGGGSAGGGGAGGGTGFGLGVQAMLAGPNGPTFVYQAQSFHIAAIFAFDTGVEDNFNFSFDEVNVGGRFFYEVHSGELSDFSLGGGFGISDDGGGNDDIDIYFEGAAQIRAFIVPNVAVNTSLGIVVEIDGDDNNDDDLELAFTGQIQAFFGLTYFFF